MKNKLMGLFIKAMAFMPLWFLRGLGGVIGVVAMKLSKRSCQRLKDNLLVTKIATPDNVAKIAKKTAQELGKTLVETTCIAWHRSKKHNASLIVEALGFEYMEEVLNSGRPVVFLTPHISNFEIALKATAYHIKRVFTVLYKPSKDQWFNQMMIDGRTENNIKPVPTNRMGVFTLAKDLRAGGVIGVLPDSIASSGDGVWIEFFGKKVFAPTLASKMVLTPGVESFIVATKRVRGGFKVNYIPFKPIDNDITRTIQDIYKVIEQAVLEAPEQYYWSYDRFRVPDHAQPVSE
jgi:KDO2-lipid IV(A) lauroyltransferase